MVVVGQVVVMVMGQVVVAVITSLTQVVGWWGGGSLWLSLH